MVKYSCNPENARTRAISNALDEWEAGTRETYSIPWKGTTKAFPLITMALENLVLNHRNHRIRAQIEGGSDGLQEALEQPDGDEAQEYIAIIIFEESDNFEDLSADLDRIGQSFPGVVTRAGVIVNGNRRAVALHELGQKWMKVALLPPGVSSNDMDDLEWDLQLLRELREDYTFTNQLIAINERLEIRGESPEAIGLRMGWARSDKEADLKKGAEQVARAIRVLSTIRTVQDLSKHKSHTLPLPYFDDKQQSLEELDGQLLSLQSDGVDLATIESVRNLRLVGMLAGLTKLQLRKIKADFSDEYLEPRLADEDAEPVREELAEISISSPGTIPGLSSAKKHGTAGNGTPKLLIHLAKSVGFEFAEEPDRDVSLPPDVRDKLTEVLVDAVEIAAVQTNKANRLRAPIESLRKARRAVQSARKQLVKVQSETRFKTGDMDYQLNKLEKETGTLHGILASGN